MWRVTIPSTGAGLAPFYEWTINFPGPVTGIVRCNKMVSENPKADRTVTIHGDEWKINDITDAVAWSLTQVWRREAWKASPSLVDKSGAKSTQYTGQSFDASKTDLVHDGWTHDHCAICWWALHETDNEDEGEGYRNQDNLWLCSECYCKFIRVDSLNLKAAANNAVNPSGGSGEN